MRSMANRVFFILLNRKGLKNFNSGFTLIELLVVIAIVGILGTVAIPYYNSYVIRAKLAEVEHAMAIVKNAVTTYYQENGMTFPNCPNINAIRNTLGIGVRAVNRIQGNNGLRINRSTGIIRATIANVHSTVNGQQMRLRPIPPAIPDGSLDWRWEYSAGFPEKYRNRNRD